MGIHKNIISKSRQCGKTEMTKLIMSSTYGKMEKDELMMNRHGWTIECKSPFEIRHEDGSFASGQAARIIVDHVRSEDDGEDELIEKSIDFVFPEGHNLNGKEESKTHFVGLADMLYDTFVYVHGVNVYALESVAKLAKIRCLKKAPTDIPQIEWPTGISNED